MYGQILRTLRESKGISQASVARDVGISPAHLARLESGQRGLYLEDFVRIVETLGDKPGNLLLNDMGSLGHLKPLIDRLSVVDKKVLAHIAAIVERIILISAEVRPAQDALPKARAKHVRKPKPVPKRRRS